MINYIDLMIASFIALISSFFLTFPIKKLAIKFNVVDFPNYRKIHKHVTPLLGGLAIFFGATIGLLYLRPTDGHFIEILIGSFIIIIVGVIDDKYDLRPIVKLFGQIIAATIVISSGIIIEKFTLPFIGTIDLGM